MGPINLRELVREIPDFPQPGILFRDIIPLMRQPEAFSTFAIHGAIALAGMGAVAGRN